MELTVTLLPAQEDLQVSDREYQKELREFELTAHSRGVEISSIVRVRQSAGSENLYLGEFVIKFLSALGPVVCAILAAWLHARKGRKVRLKVGEIEAEAQTVDDIKRLLELGAQEEPKKIREP